MSLNCVIARGFLFVRGCRIPDSTFTPWLKCHSALTSTWAGPVWTYNPSVVVIGCKILHFVIIVEKKNVHVFLVWLILRKREVKVQSSHWLSMSEESLDGEAASSDVLCYWIWLFFVPCDYWRRLWISEERLPLNVRTTADFWISISLLCLSLFFLSRLSDHSSYCTFPHPLPRSSTVVTHRRTAIKLFAHTWKPLSWVVPRIITLCHHSRFKRVVHIYIYFCLCFHA